MNKPEERKQIGNLILDTSEVTIGRFKACSISPSKQKLQVIKDGTKLTYDISTNFIFIPLQFGNGKYIIKLYEHVTKKKYLTRCQTELNVELNNRYVPYLHSNVYVDYENAGNIEAFVKNTFTSSDPNDTFADIKEYFSRGFAYDYVKSFLVKSGELPDIQRCFEKHMGICQDLAALAVAMFRIAGLPASLDIGYCGKTSHAWCSVFVNDEWVLYDPTSDILHKNKKKQDYTVERWY